MQETQKKCVEWVTCAYYMYNKNSFVNEKANLCFLEIDTSHGDIVKALDSQGQSREVFKRAGDEIGVFHDNSSGSRKRFVNMGDSMEVGYESNSNKKSELQKMSKRKRSKTLSDDETRQLHETMVGNTVRFCCICLHPLEEDCGGECPGCNLDVTCNLDIAYQKDGLLSNRALGQNVEPPTLNFVENPERSKDPLSVVLLTNWNNDEFYTPLNLFNVDAHNADRNEEGFLSQHAERLESFDERMGDVEDRNESSDGWFLSASGRIKFGPEEIPRRRKEKDRKVYRKGPVTRSRSKRLSKLSEIKQMKKPKDREKRKAKYLIPMSPSKTEKIVAGKVESSETEMDNQEFALVDELISTPMHAGEFSSVVRDIFSPKKSSVITYGAVSVKDVVPNSPQSFEYVNENEQHETDSRLEISLSKDESIDSVIAMANEDISTVNYLLIDGTTGRNSSATVQRTPRKKQKPREMGF